MLTGTDEHVALELVTKAKKALVDSGLLYKDFSTAQDILDRRKNLLRCTTGSPKLDSFLKGGIVIFIDTENTFRSERIFQIAEHRGISVPDEILRRIYVCKIYNTSHLEMIIQDLGKSIGIPVVFE